MAPTTLAGYEYHAFVSYSHTDNPRWVKQLVSDLRRCEMKIWFDDRQRAGDQWIDELQKALCSAETCIVCLGQNEPDRWFNEEIQAALYVAVNRRTLRIIAVLMPGARDDVPVLLGIRHHIDCRRRMKREVLVQRVIAAIRGLPDARQPVLPPGPAPTLSLREQLERQAAPACDVENAREYRLRLLEIASKVHADRARCKELAERLLKEELDRER